jgi:hypothetical protein
MLAGVLDLRKEPLVVSVIPAGDRSGRGDQPRAYMQLSWELGSFWVESDEEGLAVMHFNEDVIYGHLSLTSSADGAGLKRSFPKNPKHPVNKQNVLFD